MLFLYPDYAKAKEKNQKYGEFVARREQDPFGGVPIQPENVEYMYPDFGFDNDMTFLDDITTNYSSPWRFFMDYVTTFPKFERPKNYIMHINTLKF